MQYYLAIWSLLFGLIIGSFLNVVIYRVPRRESLVSPGSHCPRCDMAIHWYDNIPVLSWVLLKGRCRGCGLPIAVRYPLVEAITGLAFLGSYLLVGLRPAALLAWFVSAMVITLIFMQHDNGVIPDLVVFPAVIVALAASVAFDPRHWWYYVAGSAGCGLAALALSGLGSGTGYGDVKMAMFLGAVFGPYALAAAPAALILRFVCRNLSSLLRKGPIKSKDGASAVCSDRDSRKHVEAHENYERKDAEVMTWL